MAEKDQKATAKRQREARQKGQVATSQDLAAVSVFLVGLLALFFAGPMIATGFSDTLHAVLFAMDQPVTEPAVLVGQLELAAHTVLRVSMPVLGIAAVVQLAGGWMQTHFLMSAEPLIPKLERLDPMAKLKQWFSMRSIFELTKTLIKIFAVFLVAYLVLWRAAPWVLALGHLPPAAQLTAVGRLGSTFLAMVAAVFLGLAVADAAFQRWNQARDMRMSKDDIRQEHKSSEGDPLIKSQRRSLHRQMSNEEVRKAVSDADVVVVNPTHLALALWYRPESGGPEVLLKAQDSAARRVIRFAHRQGTPVVRQVRLARGLFQEVTEGESVPPQWWAAVAEILVFVEHLARSEDRRRRVWNLPKRP